MLRIDARHHIDIHSGLGSPDCRLFPVRAVTVIDDLLDCRPVGDQDAAESHLFPQDVPHQPLVPRSRNPVDGIKGCHHKSCACVDSRLVRRQIEFLQRMPGQFHRIIIPACGRCAVTGKMLHTRRDPVRLPQIVALVSLIAFHHGFGKEAVQIRILARRLHHPSPPGIPYQIHHRREGHMQAANRRFLRRHLCASLRKFRLESRPLPKRNRIDGLKAVDHIQHEKKRNLMGMLLHKILLDLLQLLRAQCS